jgi:SAM-dependent methyltransferase
MANLLRYPLPVDSALEVACGTGAYSHSLAQQSSLRVTGIDLDRSAIALANEWYGATPRLDFKVEDANAMTYRGEFGLVFCMDSLHHFASLRRILLPCYNALASDGLLYIIDLYREATPSDPLAMRILDLRRRISEREFVRQTLENKILSSKAATRLRTCGGCRLPTPECRRRRRKHPRSSSSRPSSRDNRPRLAEQRSTRAVVFI